METVKRNLCLEFLGINLDSLTFHASLPTEKLKTLSLYSSGWCRFKSFHTLNNFPFPCINITTTSFITYTHTVLKLRTSTIQVYLSGINFFSKLLSIAGTPTHPHVTMLIQGLRKAEPQLALKRLPSIQISSPAASKHSAQDSYPHSLTRLLNQSSF